MRIATQQNFDGKELTITVNGKFDFNALDDFKNSYESSSHAVDSYIIDLKNSNFMDSSALGMLLMLRDHVSKKSAKMKIINPSHDVKRIFIVTKLDELFDIE